MCEVSKASEAPIMKTGAPIWAANSHGHPVAANMNTSRAVPPPRPYQSAQRSILGTLRNSDGFRSIIGRSVIRASHRRPSKMPLLPIDNKGASAA